MKNKIINIFLVLILLCGIGVLSYPFISNILQDRKQDQILTEYNEEMEKLSDAEIEEAKEKAKQYNDSLSNTVVISDPFDPDAADDMSADYMSALNLEKNGILALNGNVYFCFLFFKSLLKNMSGDNDNVLFNRKKLITAIKKTGTIVVITKASPFHNDT